MLRSPHREHESNALQALLCRAGLHRWHKVSLDELAQGREVRDCFWCPKLRINGVIHTP